MSRHLRGFGRRAVGVVIGEKLFGVSAAEVAVEDGEVDLREVHQHQRIERFTKRRINVETNQPCIQFQVLAEEHGHSLSFLLYSRFAVMLVLGYVWLPFVALPLFVTLETLDFRLLEAASDLWRGGEPPGDDAVIAAALRIERSASGGRHVAADDVVPITKGGAVQVYTSAGTFISSTSTNGLGKYLYKGLPSGNAPPRSATSRRACSAPPSR